MQKPLTINVKKVKRSDDKRVYTQAERVFNDGEDAETVAFKRR